jgi:(2Fe-2S) ferredoxin
MAESPAQQRFYVCVNTSCRGGGSLAIRDALTARLADGTGEVREQVCFGACWMGPNVVLHPQGTWYCGVAVDDIDDILAHASGGAPVERLIDRSDPGLCEQVERLLKSIAG